MCITKCILHDLHELNNVIRIIYLTTAADWVLPKAKVYDLTIFDLDCDKEPKIYFYPLSSSIFFEGLSTQKILCTPQKLLEKFKKFFHIKKNSKLQKFLSILKQHTTTNFFNEKKIYKVTQQKLKLIDSPYRALRGCLFIYRILGNAEANVLPYSRHGHRIWGTNGRILKQRISSRFANPIP